VYQQHKRYMRGTEYENMEPRDFFDQDISKEIQNKIENTNIILMIDVNQNVIKGSFTKRMEEMGMINVFKRINMGQMPATHHRGRFPISTIYVSENLTPTRAGILPKTKGVQGDHRNMYVDIIITCRINVERKLYLSAPVLSCSTGSGDDNVGVRCY